MLVMLAWALVPLAARAAPPRDDAERALYGAVLAKADQVRPQLSGLDAPQRERLFALTAGNPVASLDVLARYDPDGLIGFCFGRSMTAHLTARRMGLAERSVRKLFILGDLRQLGAPRTEWRFHVTTLVRGTVPGREWYAIDPIVGRVLTARQWIQYVQRVWDHQHRAHFYVVHPSVVLPDVTEVPAPEAETGKHLIELAFEPVGKPGFTPRPELAPAAFEVAQARARHDFFDADRFNFAGITINGGDFGYRNYFADLFADLGRRADGDFLDDAAPPPRPFARSTLSAGTGARASVGLGSMHFGRILRR